MIVLILSLAALASVSVDAQVPQFGNCPEVTYQQNFEPEKYFSGVYYEQKRFWTIFEIGSKCVNAEYTIQQDGHVQVNNSGVSTKKGNRYFQVGEAYCDSEKKSNCFVRFYPGTPYGNYNLLAADPDKYGLVFTCRQVIPNILNTQYAWILTREKEVSEADMNMYLDVFQSNHINIDMFRTTVQDCSDN